MFFNQWLLILIFGLRMQAASLLPSAADGLTSVERERLQREQKIDNRIKIYENASARLFKTLEAAVLKEDFQSVPAILKFFTTLLNLAIKDIDQNESRKRKSRALIRYEIQLHKTISGVQGFKIRAPVDQQDDFDAWLNRAEEIRKKFMDILFPD
jgi:hypothetical protein